jgi:hypothetical protein
MSKETVSKVLTFGFDIRAFFALGDAGFFTAVDKVFSPYSSCKTTEHFSGSFLQFERNLMLTHCSVFLSSMIMSS